MLIFLAYCVIIIITNIVVVIIIVVVILVVTFKPWLAYLVSEAPGPNPGP